MAVRVTTVLPSPISIQRALRLFQNGLDARLLIWVRVKLLHCFDLRFFRAVCQSR